MLGSAIAALSNPAGGILGEGAQLAADLGATASQSAALTSVPEQENKNETPQPESGINFVLYSSENLDIVEANTGVMLVDDKINTIQHLSSDRMVITEAGFLEIFVNNDAQTPVYFDNLRVVQTSGVVSEVNAYYPFGMLIGALSFQAAGDGYNAYKFSAKELQTEINLNWGDHGARMADYTIGRWWVPDPMMEWRYRLSPYNYASNNPINRIDPTGMIDFDWLKGLLKRVGDFFNGSSVIPLSELDWSNFDTVKDLIGLDEIIITGTGPAAPQSYDQTFGFPMWGYGKGGYNAGSAKYYGNPIDITDMLSIRNGANTKSSFFNRLRGILGLESSTTSFVDKVSGDSDSDADANAKNSTGDDTDISGKSTPPSESPFTSEDSTWVGYWDHSGFSPRHFTHKILKRDTAEYNRGNKRTTRKDPVLKR